MYGVIKFIAKFLHPVFQREDTHNLFSPAVAYVTFQMQRFTQSRSNTTGHAVNSKGGSFHTQGRNLN